MKKKPKTKEQLIAEGMNYETSLLEQVKKSANTDRLTRNVALGVIAVMAFAIAMIMPLKQTIVYLIREDAQTGTITVVGVLDEEKLTYHEARDKYWLAEYVKARETYDWYTLQKDYNLVGLLSVPLVAKQYEQLFQGENALDKKYANKIKVNVEILSIVPSKQGTATVRFKRTVKRNDDDTPNGGQVSTAIATIAYTYKTTARMDNKTRLANPFGFQVESYRVDEELK